MTDGHDVETINSHKVSAHAVGVKRPIDIPGKRK